MLEIVWKIIRGMHHWPETQARVTSVLRYMAPPRKGQSRSKVIVGFRYRTLNGGEFSGTFSSDINSTLYAMVEGDTFSLSYNPSRPERYWSDIYGLGFGDRSLLITFWLIGMVTILIVILTSK
jgi:hypothetical protein